MYFATESYDAGQPFYVIIFDKESPMKYLKDSFK